MNVEPASPECQGQPVSNSCWGQIVILCFLLAMLTLTAFLPALGNGFVNLDDPAYVTANPHVAHGFTLAAVKWAFLNAYSGNWHPLTWLSHMADCTVFGLEPWGHHLTNVLLHVGNTVLVFLVLVRMTGALWQSLVVAALFGVHPVRVESVAWIAERKDVLSALFFLLTVWAYARYAEQTTGGRNCRSIWYSLALGFFALGLLSKPMLVTLPFLLLLLDYWPLGRFERRISAWNSGTIRPLLLQKLPFLALAAISCVITFAAQKTGGGMTGGSGLTLAQRLENALVSCARYLGKLFWPSPLEVAYPYPPGSQWPTGIVLLCAALLVAASILVFYARRRYLVTGWLWYLGMLVPVIGLVQVGVQAMADRYLYLPAIGVFIMAVWGFGELFRKLTAQRMVCGVCATLVIFACVPVTWRQIGYWKNSATLFRHAFLATPENYMAHFYLGNSLAEQGRLDEALAEFNESLRLRPNSEVGVALGVFLLQQHRLDDAIAQFQNAIEADPNLPEAHYRLGSALFQKGDLDRAIEQYRRTLKLQPDYFDAHNDLGVALNRKGETDAALSQFQRAADLQPDSADARYNLANALLKKGRLEEAIAEFGESLRLRPDAPDVRNNLGVALTRNGRLDEAIAQFRQAVALRPDYAEAQRNLAAALAFKNKGNAGK